MSAGDHTDRVNLQIVDLTDGVHEVGFGGCSGGATEQAEAGKHYLAGLLLREGYLVLHGKDCIKYRGMFGLKEVVQLALNPTIEISSIISAF